MNFHTNALCIMRIFTVVVLAQLTKTDIMHCQRYYKSLIFIEISLKNNFIKLRDSVFCFHTYFMCFYKYNLKKKQNFQQNIALRQISVFLYRRLEYSEKAGQLKFTRPPVASQCT
jgi:hypothetical protein